LSANPTTEVRVEKMFVKYDHIAWFSCDYVGGQCPGSDAGAERANGFRKLRAM